jgi:hypothetical protein
MKKITLFTMVVVACFAVKISAQSEATVSSTASASLLVAMSLSETSPLNFGSSLLTNTAGRTIVLHSNSTNRDYTGGVATSAATPAPTTAAFNVVGTGLETYAIVLPSLITVWHTSISTGVHTMDINSMTARFNGAVSNTTTSTLESNGTDSFTLGATLNVQEDQIGGQYSGTFQVSVDYN